MKTRKYVFLFSMLLMIAWTSLAHAQNVEEPSGRQENTLDKLMSMLNHADELPENPVTFKKLQDQGEQVRLS